MYRGSPHEEREEQAADRKQREENWKWREMDTSGGREEEVGG